MPKIWEDTIDAHRRAVREAALDATAALVAQRGVRAVTMSQIADKTGIGRATLYKYFSDVESLLDAWHERQIEGHLEYLVALRDRSGDPVGRLEAVLEAYALIQHLHPGTELVAALHSREHVAKARQRLVEFIRDLIADGTVSGHLRTDVASDELANYCVHALGAATALADKAAVHRLVTVTVAGLKAPA